MLRGRPSRWDGCVCFDLHVTCRRANPEGVDPAGSVQPVEAVLDDALERLQAAGAVPVEAHLPK